jgi:hypothetical protein
MSRRSLTKSKSPLKSRKLLILTSMLILGLQPQNAIAASLLPLI